MTAPKIKFYRSTSGINSSLVVRRERSTPAKIITRRDPEYHRLMAEAKEQYDAAMAQKSFNGRTAPVVGNGKALKPRPKKVPNGRKESSTKSRRRSA